jgi:GT2 family glycosyltransferase
LDELIHQIPVRVFAVIVLYKMAPSESPALRTLRAALSGFKDGQADIEILLYDNTPTGQYVDVLPADVKYKADFKNSGLATAYNYALEIATEKGFDWLLTLDQDTTLPIDFMRKLFATATFVAPLSNVAAIVPHISGDGMVISPSIPRQHWLKWRHFPDEYIGISTEKMTLAVNSASTYRVSALREIGGYDPRYWIDFSDVLLYHRLHEKNFRVFVAGNIHVVHEASVLDIRNRVSPGRYENIDRAEEAFFDECLGTTERLVLLLKLLYRLVYKLWKARLPLPYFKVGLIFLCRRLFWSRKSRMENWRHSIRQESVL